MLEEVEGCRCRSEYERTFSRPPLDVVIAGAQKSGTTSLKEYIGIHDKIETHEQKEFGYLVRDEQYNKGYDNIFDEYFSSDFSDDIILLVKSVGVMYIEEAMIRTYHNNDDLKIIVSVRDPVQRAHSAYWYMRQIGWETAESFEAALKLEKDRLEERGELARHCGYIDRGMYGEQIHSLFELFSKENVIVVKFSDINDRPNKVSDRIFGELGLDSIGIEEMNVHNKTKGVASESIQRVIKRLQRSEMAKVIRGVSNKMFGSVDIGGWLRWVEELNQREFTKPKIRPETRDKLVEVFRPDIRRTERLTGMDLSHWLE